MVKNKPDVLHQCTYVVVVKPEVTGSDVVTGVLKKITSVHVQPFFNPMTAMNVTGFRNLEF